MEKMGKTILPTNQEEQRTVYRMVVFLADKVSQKRILVRLRRVAQGNYGDYNDSADIRAAV